MKTLLALLAFSVSASCLAQSLQDIQKAQVRMRIKVIAFTADGVICDPKLLEKNKLGKEVLSAGNKNDPFASAGDLGGEAFAAPVITVIDLASQPIKVGESKDVTLFPVEVLSGAKKRYAYSATNALLAIQGKFKQEVTPALVMKMAFSATLFKNGAGKILMKPEDWRLMEKPDPFGDQGGKVITLIGIPSAGKAVLYPTAVKDAYALAPADAWKTWQTRAP